MAGDNQISISQGVCRYVHCLDNCLTGPNQHLRHISRDKHVGTAGSRVGKKREGEGKDWRTIFDLGTSQASFCLFPHPPFGSPQQIRGFMCCR